MQLLKSLAIMCLALCIQGCASGGISVATEQPSAAKLRDVVSGRNSQISAAAEAADSATDRIEDTTVRASVKGPISVIRSLAGPATDKDRAEAMALVVKAQSGKLSEAQAGWSKARADADAKNAEIAELNRRIESERAAAKLEMEQRLREANDRADAARKRLMTIIFFGFGALGVAGGVVILILSANPMYAANPLVGPKAGLAVIGGGLSLIATGIAVNAIERALDTHPWVIGAGVGVAVLLIAVATALIYANHHHATKPNS